MLRNQWGRYLQHHELYPLLGIPGSTLPDAGLYKAIRTGLRVVEYTCTPVGVSASSSPRGGHRLKFRCDCGRWIPFGRAGQHLPKCEAYARTEATFTSGPTEQPRPQSWTTTNRASPHQ